MAGMSHDCMKEMKLAEFLSANGAGCIRGIFLECATSAEYQPFYLLLQKRRWWATESL